MTHLGTVFGQFVAHCTLLRWLVLISTADAMSVLLLLLLLPLVNEFAQ